jgi:hypothetical protein
MKRRGALRIHEQLKGMTFEEQMEYWRKRSEQFRKEQLALGKSRGAALAKRKK